MGLTQAQVLENLLNSIDNTYNKTQGEFIWDFCNTVAKTINDAYNTYDNDLNKNFVATASGKDLDNLILQRIGQARQEATYTNGIVKVVGTVGATINKGDYVASNSYNYAFTDTTTIGSGGIAYVNVQCTTIGSGGNTDANTIIYFPKTLNGITSVTNEAAFTNGYDAQTDDDYKNEYYTIISNPATSGNISHYKEWALSVSGVGDCTVIASAGNVNVVIVDNNKQPATTTLVNNVTNYINANRPVLAGTLSVVAATGVVINVGVKVTYNTTSYTQAQIITNITHAINSYIVSSYGSGFISYAKIGNAILSATGVQDYSSLTINSGTSNITISNLQVATIGSVTLG